MEIIVTQLEAGSFFLSTSVAPAAADRSSALNYGARRMFSPPGRAAVNRYQNSDEAPASDKPIPQSTESDATSEERVEGLPDADPQADRVDTDARILPSVANPH
jgi:hypothetical protein